MIAPFFTVFPPLDYPKSLKDARTGGATRCGIPPFFRLAFLFPLLPLPSLDRSTCLDACGEVHSSFKSFFLFFIFGNIVPLHKSYSDVGNMGSIFSATLQPILHVPGNIIIFGTEILECTQIVGKIRNRNIIIFSAKKKFFFDHVAE